jgi:hypothetical protein
MPLKNFKQSERRDDMHIGLIALREPMSRDEIPGPLQRTRVDLAHYFISPKMRPIRS